MSIMVTIPKPINASVIDTYSVTQDVGAWSNTISYSTGHQVTVDGIDVYESVVDNNLDNNPTAVNSSAWNKLDNPTNWAGMFDQKVGTVTKAIGSISLTILLPDITNTLALLNMDKVKTITLSSVVGGQTVWSNTKTTYRRSINGLYDVFFAKHEFVKDVLFMDLPHYKNQQLVIEIVGDPGVEISVGKIIVGERKQYGQARWKFTSRRKTYSSKTEDQFGNISVIKRALSSKRLSLQLVMQPERVATYENNLVALDAVPVLWVLSERYESTIIYGFYEDFENQFNDSIHAYCTLKLQGMS